SKGGVVCFQQSAKWFQLWVLGFAFGFSFLRTRNRWNCGGGSDSGYSHNGFFLVHSDFFPERLPKTIVERSHLSHDFFRARRHFFRNGGLLPERPYGSASVACRVVATNACLIAVHAKSLD